MNESSDKTTDCLIEKIENALGFKFYPWQKDYLQDKSEYMPPDRCNGKTTAYCVKLAMLLGKSIKREEIIRLADGNYGPHYGRWFLRYFMEIREKLKNAGLNVCEIKNYRGDKVARASGTNIIRTAECRPCIVVGRGKGLFHRWGNCASVHQSVARNQICNTLAIVEMEDGAIVKCEPDQVRFVDNMCADYDFTQYETQDLRRNG